MLKVSSLEKFLKIVSKLEIINAMVLFFGSYEEKWQGMTTSKSEPPSNTLIVRILISSSYGSFLYTENLPNTHKNVSAIKNFFETHEVIESSLKMSSSHDAII